VVCWFDKSGGFYITHKNTHPPPPLSPPIATLPRYDPFCGTRTGKEKTVNLYRDPTIWQRTVASVPKDTARGKTSIRFGNKILLLTNFVCGPADVVGYSLYDPQTSVAWSVSLTGTNIVYPWLNAVCGVSAEARHAEARKEKEVQDAKDAAEAALRKKELEDEENDVEQTPAEAAAEKLKSDEEKATKKQEFDEASSRGDLIKIISERLVWKTLVIGVSNTIISTAQDKLLDPIEKLQKASLKSVVKLESLQEELAALRAEEAEEAYMAYNKQYRLSAGLKPLPENEVKRKRNVSKKSVADEYSAASFTISTSRLDSEHALVSAPINPALQRVKAGAHEERSRSRNNSDMSEFDDVRASGTSGGGTSGGASGSRHGRHGSLKSTTEDGRGHKGNRTRLNSLKSITSSAGGGGGSSVYSGTSASDSHVSNNPVPVMPSLRIIENEANIILHGMIIPADEALPGIPFEVNSRDWLSMLYYFQLYNDNQKGMFDASKMIFHSPPFIFSYFPSFPIHKHLYILYLYRFHT